MDENVRHFLTTRPGQAMFRPVVREPRALFLAQRSGAEQRGIPWRFTFDEWWALWEPHWERRVPDKLCLCRNGDAGAYEVGNCRIDTAYNNLAEQHELRGAITADPSVKTVQRERIKREIARERLERETYDLPTVLADIERGAILDALHAYRWNKTQAGKALGLTFRQMRYKVREHGLLDDDAA